MYARRSSVAVYYNSTDISGAIDKDLLSFSYVDNASGEADSISISLKDDNKKWVGSWFPTKGDLVSTTIRVANWRQNGDKNQMHCGHFYVDEPEYSGRPRILTINAISSPLNGNFSSIDRSKTWRNITLKAISEDIGKRHGLSIQYIGKNNPKYSSIEQTETPDSTFLSDLCNDEGLAMKVTDNKIVIFDEKEFEARNSVYAIYEENHATLSYSFNSSLANTAYAGVNVKYYDAKLGRKIEFLFAPGDIDKEKDKIYQLNSKVSTGDDARRLAQRTLRKLNKNETTGRLSVIGNLDLLGGSCVDLVGFGNFDGKYYIEKASHEIGSGYTTNIEVRRVLEGY